MNIITLPRRVFVMLLWLNIMWLREIVGVGISFSSLWSCNNNMSFSWDYSCGPAIQYVFLIATIFSCDDDDDDDDDDEEDYDDDH